MRPGLSQADLNAASPADPEGRPHRQIVEIRNAIIDPRVTFDVNHTELTLFEHAESHLLGHDRTATTAASDDEDGAP